MRGEIPRISAAIADQGAGSLGNFLITVLVGRSLGAATLGAFSIGLLVLYSAGGLITSLVIQPAVALGPQYFSHDIRRYGGRLVVTTMGVGLVLAAGGVSVGLVFSGQIWVAVANAMLIAPLVLTAWTIRGLPYLTSQPRQSAAGSFTFLAVAAIGLIGLDRLGVASMTGAFLVVATASAAQGATTMSLWKPSFRGIREWDEWIPVASRHWRYGRWLLASEGSSWITTYGFSGLAAAVVGLAGAGGYRAGQSLMRVAGIVFSAMSLLYVPRLARARKRQGSQALPDLVRPAGLLLSGVGVLVALPALAYGEDILALLFGREFSQFGWVFAGLMVTLIPQGWVVAYRMGLEAGERSRSIFTGQLVAAIVGAACAVALGLLWGLTGVVAAVWLSSLGKLIAYRRSFRRLVGASFEASFDGTGGVA